MKAETENNCAKASENLFTRITFITKDERSLKKLRAIPVVTLHGYWQDLGELWNNAWHIYLDSISVTG